LDRETAKTKIIDLDDIYNFVVDDFFHLNSFPPEIFIKISIKVNAK
jgi:hypothetical protein